MGVEWRAVKLRLAHARSERIIFPLICGYLASQVLLVPILPVGPWAIWPSLSDIIILLMIPAVLFSARNGSPHIKPLWRFSAIAALCCLGSFIWAFAFLGAGKGTLFGIQQLYRVAQILIVLLASSKVLITPRRIRILARIALGVLIFNCLAVLATAFGFPARLASPLLPDDALISGPWSWFVSGLGEGTGFLGYNHAYNAIHLLLCAGLTFSVNKLSDRWRFPLHLLLLAAMLVTKSRAGFICALIFILAYELGQSRRVVLGLGIAALVVFMVNIPAISEYSERQTSSASSLSDDGFSGRTERWQEHLDYLSSHPAALILGVGFGQTFSTSLSDNAHMLYLHIATELGLFGLGAFVWSSWRLLRLLKDSAMYWCFIALLLTGLAQETFYPTVASLGFMAFFALAVVLVVRIRKIRTVTLTIRTQ